MQSRNAEGNQQRLSHPWPSITSGDAGRRPCRPLWGNITLFVVFTLESCSQLVHQSNVLSIYLVCIPPLSQECGS